VDAVYINDFIKELQDLFYVFFADRAVIKFTGVTALMARSIPAALHRYNAAYGRIVDGRRIQRWTAKFLGSMKLFFSWADHTSPPWRGGPG